MTKESKKVAVANRKMCIGCRLCNPEESPCPAAAITYDAIGKVIIDEKLCTGCSLCAKRCPKGIISIINIHTHE